LSKTLAAKKEPAQLADERQSQLKLLIARGKEQGYLTYVEVNDHLPSEIVDPEQIEDIVNMINDMGIPVYEKAPESEALLLTEPVVADEEAAEEAAAALATVDAEFGRTTDPVRMYMREMGTVELLTREGEIRIAKRIEEGLDAVRTALSSYPLTYNFMLNQYEQVKAGQGRLVDIITGFIDPNAPDEIAAPVKRKRSRPVRIRKRPRAASCRSASCISRSSRRWPKTRPARTRSRSSCARKSPASSWS
jgi:RNA polymerase primary sigma factor